MTGRGTSDQRTSMWCRPLGWLGTAAALLICAVGLAQTPEATSSASSGSGPSAAGDNSPGRYAFCVGKVVTMDSQNRVLNNAVVLVANGKIEQIGLQREVEVPEGYQRIERPDLWLVPGLIDPHNHSAGAMSDLHDYVYLTNPGLRTVEALEPESENNRRARAGGVTTVLMLPGSGNNLSGFGTLTKLGGKNVDEMLIRMIGCLKIAQAGNPERYWYGVGRAFMYYNLRQTLQKAQAYHHAWDRYERGETDQQPEFDLFWDDFRDVFRRQSIALVHTQMYQVMMSTIDMLVDKFEIRVVLGHSTFDGYKTAPLVVRHDDVYTSNGPREIYFDRQQRRIMGHAARWWHGGIRHLGVNTDAGVLPQEEVSYQAAMACHFGWQPYPALRGLTRVAAEALMIEDRVGSIEAGKDADLGLWTGDPVDPRSSCELTMINGRIEYDASKQRRF